MFQMVEATWCTHLMAEAMYNQKTFDFAVSQDRLEEPAQLAGVLVVAEEMIHKIDGLELGRDRCKQLQLDQCPLQPLAAEESSRGV